MLRNLLLSLALHLGISMAAIPFYLSSPAAFSLALVMTASFAGYVVLGYKLLRPIRSGAWSLYSAGAPSMIGLAMGLYFWAFPGMMGFHWMIFLGYNMYAFALSSICGFSPRPEGTFWFFAVPSLLMWAGVRLQRYGLTINRWIEEASK
ncbi:hypothetical protein [Cohnella sp. JJ-181]|uniref:hypothetical protein n=1 Tax=Cohnella rhizoplanae TaxID=2974897 RepID=UPI0022FFAC64|nr:hypothetical protein [Cohnella sp. JJ-181]CAI6065974.1 hypothetical protein COHCIP112018_02083 [Cohnella sp. JJ-181]